MCFDSFLGVFAYKSRCFLQYKSPRLRCDIMEGLVNRWNVKNLFLDYASLKIIKRLKMKARKILLILNVEGLNYKQCFMKKMLFGLISLLLLSCTSTTSTKTNKNADEALAKIRQAGEEVYKLFISSMGQTVFDVDYVLDGKNLVVKGDLDSSTTKEMLLIKLESLGYTIQDSLRLLPEDTSLGDKKYGVVNLSVCNLHSKADFSSEMVTQGLLGMPIHLLDFDNWYRINMPDGYVAWVHRAAIVSMTKEEYDVWNRAEKIIVTSHYGFTYEKADVKSQTVSDVVSGNRLKWEGTEGNFYKVSYPDGRKAYVARAISQPESEWRKVLKQDPESILATAKTLLGVPYLWAGTSAKGMDCSGFVRTVLFMHDIIIPRDAYQQAKTGDRMEIAPDFANLQPGDLLFFGRKATPESQERVVHVGIYIGDKKFIHSQGDVHISSLDVTDADFDEFNLNRLLFGTRFLHQLGTFLVSSTNSNFYYCH